MMPETHKSCWSLPFAEKRRKDPSCNAATMYRRSRCCYSMAKGNCAGCSPESTATQCCIVHSKHISNAGVRTGKSAQRHRPHSPDTPQFWLKVPPLRVKPIVPRRAQRLRLTHPARISSQPGRQTGNAFDWPSQNPAPESGVAGGSCAHRAG